MFAVSLRFPCLCLVQDSNGALALAAVRGHEKIVEFLVVNGFRIDEIHEVVMCLVCLNSYHIAVVVIG